MVIFTPKMVAYTLGGALIAEFLFHNITATIIGGLIGFVISIIK